MASIRVCGSFHGFLAGWRRQRSSGYPGLHPCPAGSRSEGCSASPGCPSPLQGCSCCGSPASLAWNSFSPRLASHVSGSSNSEAADSSLTRPVHPCPLYFERDCTESIDCLGRARACTVFLSCPALCDSKNCNPPVSSVLGIIQARTLEWAVLFSSSRSSPPRDGT